MKPSKEELKAKYQIANDDFDVLTELPTAEEVRAKGGFLLRVGELLGAPTWLWKNWSGAVIAVIIAISSGIGHFNNLSPIAISSYDHLSDFFAAFRPIGTDEPVKYVAFIPARIEKDESLPKPDYASFSAGTAIFVVSGSFNV